MTPEAVALPPVLAALPDLPLVSCLMVTKDRLALARRSIRYFADQRYPRCELVVVCEGSASYFQALEEHVEQEGIDDVRLLSVEPGMPLGMLRNLSVDLAAGDVVCVWDDDDGHHPDRVMRQLEYMIENGGRACFLTDHLQFFGEERMLFWIDWKAEGPYKAQYQLLPCTLMMFKDARFRYPEAGPYAHLSEDLELTRILYRNVRISALSGMGHLFLYNFHGRNTFPKEHHFRITIRSISNARVRARSEVICRALTTMGFPGRDVYGSEGRVFSVNQDL